LGTIVLAAVALAAVAAGCGDDDGGNGDGGAGGDDASSEQRQEYVDAIVALADDDDNEAFTAEHRTCVAESFVDGYGVDELADADVTPDDIRSRGADGPGELGLDFSDAQASDFYDRMSGCMDLRTVVLDSVASEIDDPEVLDCLDENVTDDLLERVVVAGFTEGDDAFAPGSELEQEYQGAIMPCVTLAGP
jgi:hypothetical protein